MTSQKKTSAATILKTIKKDLQSSNDQVVLKALKKVRDKGDVSIVKHLLNLYTSTSNDEIKSTVKLIISELKISDAVTPLIDYLSNNNEEANELILYALWHANLNPVNHIPEIIEACCKGNYMTALEGLTVIENLDGPFQEDVLSEAKLILNDYFQSSEDEKTDLMKSILGLIQDFDNSIL